MNNDSIHDPPIGSGPLKEKTKESQVGSLFLMGFDGTTITKEVEILITKYKVNSFILSGRNFINVQQTKKLIRDIQLLALRSGYDYPVVFAIDEEGGMLNSLFDKNFITQFPGAMALAATGSEELVYQVYKKVALELKSIGFSLFLGPVLDVLKDFGALKQEIIGVRSFGYNTQVVTRFAKVAATAFKDVGIYNCGKHFPGYGSATVNSNFELPMLLENSEQLMQGNLVPYKQLISENLLDCILVGGCAVPRVNGNDIHACLSPTIVTNILRQQLNFNGLVISECMLLEALDKTFGVIQGCISAISVGCDLIMLCNNFKIQEEAINALRTVTIDNLLDSSVIDSSLKRIELLHKSLPSWSEILNNDSITSKELNEHVQLSKMAYEKSITMVRDAGIPITNFLIPNRETENSILLLTPLISPLYETIDEFGNKSHINSSYEHNHDDIQYGEDVFMELGKLLAQFRSGFKFVHTSYNSNGLTSFHENLILKSKVVLFVSAETTKNMYQIGVAKHVSMLCNQQIPSSLAASKDGYCTSPRQMIIISVSSPMDFLYDINYGSLPCGYICTYDYTMNSLSNIPGILFGTVTPSGKIPGIVITNEKYQAPNNKLYTSSKQQKRKHGMHSWLVEEFQFHRDWENLISLLKNNNIISQYTTDSLSGLKLFFQECNYQKSFVVRNTSSNTLLGISVTWSKKLNYSKKNVGKILLLLVDRNKRNISIGQHLYSKTRRYLFNECGCSPVYLANDFPQITVNNLLLDNTIENNYSLNFFKSYNWQFDSITWGKLISTENKLTLSREKSIKHLMKLEKLNSWKVSENLVRQLQVVGIMFDICNDPANILSMMTKSDSGDESSSLEVDLAIFELYSELHKDFKEDSKEYLNESHDLHIIVALEPTKKQIVGSLVVFTNHSKFSKFFPVLPLTGENQGKDYACITGLFIDPLYATLSEVFKLGLICTALMYIKKQHSNCTSCFITDIEENQLKSLKDNCFEVATVYNNFYSEMW